MLEIFFNVLDMTKTASLVIVWVLLARLALKKAPKIFTYALWIIVLIRLLCPVVLRSPFSIVPEVQSIAGSYALNGGIGIQQSRVLQNVVANVSRTELLILLGQYVWLIGILIMGIYALISYIRLRRSLVTASPLRDNIYLADGITSAFVMGIFRPKIYLPSTINEREHPYIIIHEQYHIRRFDHIVKILAFAALCIHWFNPFVWIAFIMTSRDMEMSCDEAVIKKMGRGVLADYTATLLSVATGKRTIAGTALAFGECDTKGRIKNLVKWKKPAPWVIFTASVVCALLAIALLTSSAGTPLNRLTIDEVDIRSALSDISSMTAEYDGKTIVCDRGSVNRFLATMGKIKVQNNPISLSRSEERDKSFTITVNDGVNIYFSRDFSEVWFDNGVKPSFSYKISNPESAEELLLDFKFTLAD